MGYMYIVHVMKAHEPKQSSVENSTQEYDYPIKTARIASSSI